eukprot:TRINITY_DN80_c0_g1_i1.p1 TRINITY_DN80_c0_g1~~TRINITY_DN80_c0_g1_i1.p1  ORF type:complete len:107 (-),score=22.85 TRINITY_DN80_c0_g1_i1:90-410(-)
MVIKEGCHYKMRVTFRVQHNIVLGLKISSSISRLGKKIKDEEMLGTYPPSNEFTAVDLPKNGWHEAPSGKVYRGDYKSKMRFTDDDGEEHLVFDWLMKISKKWGDE